MRDWDAESLNSRMRDSWEGFRRRYNLTEGPNNEGWNWSWGNKYRR